MTATAPLHFVQQGAPACRPNSGHFWGLMGTKSAAEFAAEEHKCMRCERSKRWAFAAHKLAAAHAS